VEPDTQRRSTLEVVEGAPGSYERLLHGVVDLGPGSKEAAAVGGQLVPVSLEATHRRDVGIKVGHVAGTMYGGAGLAIDHPSTVSSVPARRHQGPP
jgi:hypothetical protein